MTDEPTTQIESDSTILGDEPLDTGAATSTEDLPEIPEAVATDEVAEAAETIEATETLPEAPKSEAPLENIEVRIDFSIGEISMPVNQLAALAPGFTLTDLPGLIFPQAKAMSAGRAFAEGELVEIDGKIGFRITRLLS